MKTSTQRMTLALRRSLAALGVLLAWAGPAWSGWKTLGVADGLAGNSVYSILEDREENLWFGTNNGVSLYNGWSWRTFTTTDGLGAERVLAIHEDRAGNLWFGTRDGGVSRYTPRTGSWRTFTTADGLANNGAGAILEDRAGSLWFATLEPVGDDYRFGLSRYDPVSGSWKTFTTADGLANGIVTRILEDRTGNLWFGTTGGVSRYDGVSWRTFTTADGLIDNNVYSMLEDRAGNLWFGTLGGGVSRHDPRTGTWETVRSLRVRFVAAIVEDRIGNFWFVGRGGAEELVRYDPQAGTWRTFTQADGPIAIDLVSAMEDHSGNLWFGSGDGDGLSRYDGTGWKTYTRADGLASDFVTQVLEDRDGKLWFATAEGASCFEPTSMMWSTPASLAGDFVQQILEDHSGSLWFRSRNNEVSRYDGVGWRSYGPADGLGGSVAYALEEDGAGNIWVGTEVGVSRYDPLTQSWRSYTQADGLAGTQVSAIEVDRAGTLWFATDGGLSHHDPVAGSWTTHGAADGLPPGAVVSSIHADRAGNVWLGYGTYDYVGVTRYDGTSFRTFTPAEGAPGVIAGFLEDQDGNLWFGTPCNDGCSSHRGVSRFDGSGWQFYSFIGPSGRAVPFGGIAEDRDGNLWFQTEAGAAHYLRETSSLTTYFTTEGAPSVLGNPIVDHSGRIWFGATVYEPDHRPPQTSLVGRPPSLSTARAQTVSYVAAWREVEDVEFSSSLDGSPWSPWVPFGSNVWTGRDLEDGTHQFRVRARDKELNVDETPATAVFEIDATPPTPALSSPTFGEAVRDSVIIHGTANDPRFKEYRVEVRPAGTSWDSTFAAVLAVSTSPVDANVLAGWNTSSLPDGDYEMRVMVTDTLGLTGTTQIAVVVDNHEPYAFQTTPARVNASAGGDVYTTNREAHLFFPPHGFSEDAVVTVTQSPDGTVPDNLGLEVTRVLSGYALAWGSAKLVKPCTLELSYAGTSIPAGHTPSLYVSGADMRWRRLGGTVDVDARRVVAPISEAGRYALFAEPGSAPGPATLSAISLTPRVFSPHGTFSSSDVAIGFTLGRSGTTSVKVYNRAGRLVKEVLSSAPMGAGANLVRWNGRDRDGAIVEDGLYLLIVEALGEKQTSALAVVK